MVDGQSSEDVEEQIEGVLQTAEQNPAVFIHHNFIFTPPVTNCFTIKVATISSLIP